MPGKNEIVAGNQCNSDFGEHDSGLASMEQYEMMRNLLDKDGKRMVGVKK